MNKPLGTIVFYEDFILLKYYDGYSQKFKSSNTPKYQKGTEYFDLNGDRYFLVEED